MRRQLLLGLFLLVIGLGPGCQSAPPRKMNSIEIGMPRRDVVLLMGTPAKQHREEDREVLQFSLHKDIAQPYASPEPYWVFLQDGKVIKHGRPQDLKDSGTQISPDSMADIELS